MGNNEVENPPKSEKTTSVQEQPTVHPYTEWAAMQAYFGPGVGIPPPYFSSAVVPGHAPHPYMWGPQPMMSPFGTPYPPMYPHGGAYAHPSMPLGSPAQGQGSTTSSTSKESMMVTPSMPKTPSNGKEHGLMKKLKGFDGLAVSTNNENTDSGKGSASKRCQSGEGATEGSSDGSDGNDSQEGNHSQKKRICSLEVPGSGKNGKIDMQSSSEDGDAPKISLGVALAHPNISGKAVAVPPVNMATKSKPLTTPLPLTTPAGREGVPPEHWMQDERELKREKRKQSNRESARRSRLRKQAETEELALKVENLTSENVALKTEIGHLTEMSEKLRGENSALMDKLKNPLGAGSMGAPVVTVVDEGPIDGLDNLLSRVNNSSSSDRNEPQENTTNEKSGMKLHQLLEPSSRKDAVAAS